MGGLSAECKFLDITLETGEKLALCMKSCGPGVDFKIAAGCAREAFFYNDFATNLKEAGVATAHYAHGVMETGEMVMLLECFEDNVPAGVFFGPGNPNNWAVKDKLEQWCKGNPSCEEVTALHWKLYAKMHGKYWRSEELLSKPWLRATDWIRGENQVGWETTQKQAADGWANAKQDIDAGTSTFKWDQHLIRCCEASFGKVDWKTYQAEMAARPYTLVHGDAHPHNALWVRQRTADAYLALIDFEQVGIGSAAQELGQHVISHMTPEKRRAFERDGVAAYHAELVGTMRASGNDADADLCTLESIWTEYVAGGAGRWFWFLGFFLAHMPQLFQFFHDQMAAFLEDHVKDPSDAPMPRV